MTSTASHGPWVAVKPPQPSAPPFRRKRCTSGTWDRPNWPNGGASASAHLERRRWLGFGPRYIKVGGRFVYRFDEIEAFEERQARQSTSDRIDAVFTQGAGL
jgi:hypothetical protein